MTDLRTHYLGLELRSPIVASSGPLTADVDHIARLVDAGAGAVVLPSLFEEQIEHESAEIDRLYSLHSDSFVEATSFFPEVDGFESVIDRYLALVEASADRVEAPVIASLNGTHPGGWIRYARLLADAGARALELNLYGVAADPSRTGGDVEQEQLALVDLVAAEVDIPVAVKISPYYTSVAAFVAQLGPSGAAGVVMFNRFYQPDLDLETLEVLPRIDLSTPAEIRLPMRWIGIVRDRVDISIACSTGVHSGFDAAKVILAGADVAMTTSALLRHGPEHVATIEAELADWMSEHDYAAVSEMRGAVRRGAATDPEAFERANYIGNLASYTSSFLGRQR